MKPLQPAHKVTLIHDFTSIASWLAVLHATSLGSNLVQYIGFRGFEHIGINMAIATDVQTKATFLSLQPEFAQFNEPVELPSHLPPTLHAHAITNVAFTQDWQTGIAVMTAIYRGFWCSGENIANPHVLVSLTSDHLDPQLVATTLNDTTSLNLLRRDQNTARSYHVGGVPVLQMGSELMPAILSAQDWQSLLTSI